jgi:hypothetical protein
VTLGATEDAGLGVAESAGRTGFSTRERERGAAERGEVLALRQRGWGTGSTSRPSGLRDGPGPKVHR